MQEPESSPPPRGQDRTSDKLPESTGPISDADLRKHLRSLDGLLSALPPEYTVSPDSEESEEEQERDDQPPQPPEEPVEDAPGIQPEPRGRAVWWWAVTVVALGALGTGAMTAIQNNRFCGSLGFCSVEKFETVNTALAAAQQTAQRLEEASSLKPFEADTADLEGQLVQIERDGVISDAQRDALNRLRREAFVAQARLKREHRDQRIVVKVGADLGTRSPTEQERRHWLQELQPIAASSFSHREAQTLRQRLQPPSPSGSRFNSPKTATAPSFAPKAPPLPTRDIPSPSPESGSGDNAPYRPEPLW